MLKARVVELVCVRWVEALSVSLSLCVFVCVCVCVCVYRRLSM
jgi:hypothetical protein